MENPLSTRVKRAHSYPRCHRDISTQEYDTVDFSTANDVFPVRVPLETVDMGSWRYTSSELEDIELLYELESSDILIKTSIRGTNDAVPATFRIKSVSAADLCLTCIVPGSLESMVAKLVLETDKKITYVPHMHQKDDTDFDEELRVCIVKMTASVHESGHLRDVLLFLKCDYTADSNPDSVFVSPKLTTKRTKKTSLSEALNQTPINGQTNSESVDSAMPKPQVTYLEGLPYWAHFMPWKIYSKRNRVYIQRLLMLYSLFSVIWALWQLYRHVNIIHVVMEPIIEILKAHLAFVVETFDWLFHFLTLWWHTFVSPLNILRGMLLAPLYQFATPLFQLFSQCLRNSALIGSLKSLISFGYSLAHLSGHFLLTTIQLLLKPLLHVWHSTLNSRIAVASLDFQRMRLSWIFGLVMNSFKSILNGILKLLGYTRSKQKRKNALKKYPTPLSSPLNTPSPTAVRQRRLKTMPIYYNSPLSKQN